MEIPRDNTLYGRREYWDERFQKEEAYDWFRKYESFRDLLAPLLQPTDRVLQLGCGNSSLAEDLHTDGFRNIVNIDYSSVVIDKMRQRTAHLPDLQWECMDMTNLTFPDSSFDVVLEKGTLDALIAAIRHDPWNPPQALRDQIDRVMSEVHRVLKPNGMFISLTFGQPVFRKAFMMRAKFDWDCTHWSFGDFGQYFVYALRRGSPNAPKEDVPFGPTSHLQVTPHSGDAPQEDEKSDFLQGMDL